MLSRFDKGLIRFFRNPVETPVTLTETGAMSHNIDASQDYLMYVSNRHQLVTALFHTFGGRGSPRSSFLRKRVTST